MLIRALHPLSIAVHLRAQELLSQTSHYSEKTRRSALQGLGDLFGRHPDELRRHIGDVLTALAERAVDGDAAVRATLRALLREHVLPLLEPKVIRPFMPVIMAHVCGWVNAACLPARLTSHHMQQTPTCNLHGMGPRASSASGPPPSASGQGAPVHDAHRQVHGQARSRAHRPRLGGAAYWPARPARMTCVLATAPHGPCRAMTNLAQEVRSDALQLLDILVSEAGPTPAATRMRSMHDQCMSNAQPAPCMP